MQKIASPQDLQAELRRLLAYCHGPGLPSRARLSSELRGLADRVATKMRPNDWTQKGDQWMASVQYAGGKRHDWVIKEQGDSFTVSVRTDQGVFKRKKNFDSVGQAQRYAWQFIDRADGHERLEKALKDFTKG